MLSSTFVSPRKPSPHAGAARLAERMASPLSELPFADRLVRVFARRRLRTVRDLVQLSPHSLLLEPTLGRRSLSHARGVLQSHLGVGWDAAREFLGVSERRSTSHLAFRTPAEEWATLQSRVGYDLRQKIVADTELPAGLVAFAQARGLERHRDLLAWGWEDLARGARLGRASLHVALAFYRRACVPARMPVSSPAPSGETREGDPLPPTATWRDLLRDALKQLAPTERLALTLRSGLAGPAPSVTDVAESLGISRDRVRQIESKGLDRIRRSRWRMPARQRLERTFTRNVTVLDEDAAGELLFAVGDEEFESFTFFVNEVLQGSVRAFRVSGHGVLTRMAPADLEARIERARSTARSLPYPLAKGQVMEALVKALDIDEDATCELSPFLEDEWLLEDDRESGIIAGFGSAKRNAIVEHVRRAPAPVTRSTLEGRFGRFEVPPELVLVERGSYSLPERIVDWERWQRRLPPLVRALVARHGPDRSWATGEIVPLLAEEAELPPWLNEWTLGSLLRNAVEVRYLGRNVVALSEASSERVRLREKAIDVLKKAGTPMSEEAVLQTLRGPDSLGSQDTAMMRMQKPFLLFEADRIGLYPRDVPGGLEAAERACSEIFIALDERQAGLLATELRSLLTSLGAPFADWDLRMVRSLLRQDGRFRCAPGGAVGLAEWEDVRAATQREILEELMIEHDGSVLVETALAALPTASGEPLQRTRLGLLADSIHARVVGEVIEWIPETTDPGRSSITPRTVAVLAALPEATIASFQRLFEAPRGTAELREALENWVERFAAEAANPNVEADQVERLRQLAEQLLERHAAAEARPDDVDDDARRLCSAAIDYLASFTPADTALGGLDDDEAVLDAVQGALATLAERTKESEEPNDADAPQPRTSWLAEPS